jgi:uncharacterized protein (DUF1810 family)
MSDEYDLQRFVRAQAHIYDDTLLALRRGSMPTIHMDVIFPRLMAPDDGAEGGVYGIRSLDEASAYLDFPIIGNRYRECVAALQGLADRSAETVFGADCARQLHASLTLFSEASDEFLLEAIFEVWFDGLMEENTMAALDELTEKIGVAGG